MKNNKSHPQIELADISNDEVKKLIVQKKEKKQSNKIKKLRSKSEIKEGFIRYRPSKHKGLNNAQVTERRYNGLINQTKVKNKKSVIGIILSNVLTFFNMLCFGVAAALIYVGAYKDCAFLIVVLANMLIGIIQELRAKVTVDKLVLSNSIDAKVVRNSELVSIPKNEIVLDDVIYLVVGTQIPTDSYIMEGNVEVNEALLTGESLPIKKKKGDLLLAGSFISSGSCYARVENVGKENYIEKLSIRAKRYTKPKSQLMFSLKLIISIIGVIILPMSILTYYNNSAVYSGDMYLTVTKTAGSIIGMIPAGMFLLTSMALAVGVIRLAKKRTLVQELYCIEMLARSNVLCLDKTGTLTDGSMKVAEVIKITRDSEELTTEQIIAALFDTNDYMNTTAQALINSFNIKNKLAIDRHVAFSSEKKYSGVSIRKHGSYKLGALEYVLANPGIKYKDKVEELSKKGLRVLALVKCKTFDDLNGDIISLIALEDNIRKDAPETIKWFKENNVEIKIISGDNPITVSEIARRVGVENYDKYISLQNMSKEEVVRAAAKYSIFGRVSPEQKAILIKALKVMGKKVAMTGDGVNDILALKEADCSIAIAAGSDAARSVSHMVLLDSDFSSMPSVVAEGRRVVNNIQKSSSLFLMKTIFVIIISVFVLLYQKTYPFSPIQFFLLENFIIGIPSFFLALQPNNKIIEGNFLSNVLKSAFPAGLVLSLNVIAIYFFQAYTGISNEVMVTMSSVTITIFGIIALYHFCRPFNIYKGILLTACTILIFTLLFSLPNLFGYVNLSLTEILFVIVCIMASNPIYIGAYNTINSIRIPIKDLNIIEH